MRVVVTGATGFVGRLLVRESAIDPHVRRGAHAVVHLAGAGIFDERRTETRKRTLRDSRIRTAAALVNALGGVEPAERPQVLLSASAIGWYGDRGDSLLAEDGTPTAGWLVARDLEAVFDFRIRRIEELMA